MSTVPKTELGELKGLAEDIGAKYDSAAEDWTLPYYIANDGVVTEKRMPVDEWVRARQVAAIAVDKMLRDRNDTAFADMEEGVDTMRPKTARPDQRYHERRHQYRRREDRDEVYANIAGGKLCGEQFDMAKPEPLKWSGDLEADNWQHRADTMRCRTCMFYVPKLESFPTSGPKIGRCRESSPTLKGWPAVYPSDWCGAHKLDADRI